MHEFRLSVHILHNIYFTKVLETELSVAHMLIHPWWNNSTKSGSIWKYSVVSFLLAIHKINKFRKPDLPISIYTHQSDQNYKTICPENFYALFIHDTTSWFFAFGNLTNQQTTDEIKHFLLIWKHINSTMWVS